MNIHGFTNHPKFGMAVKRIPANKDTPAGHTRFKHAEQHFVANNDETPKNGTGDKTKLDAAQGAHYDATKAFGRKGDANVTGPALKKLEAELAAKATD